LFHQEGREKFCSGDFNGKKRNENGELLVYKNPAVYSTSSKNMVRQCKENNKKHARTEYRTFKYANYTHSLKRLPVPHPIQ